MMLAPGPSRQMSKEPPLILLSGMGADDRVFAKQREVITRLVVPAWIDPIRGESLPAYAERFAHQIDPGTACFIGGASFGGFVALEMIPHLDVLACFLIGSVRSPDEFPRRLSILRKTSRASGVLPFEVLSLLSKAALISRGHFPSSHVMELIKQLSDADATFLRWACRAVLQWQGCQQAVQVPIYQIHGERDFVLPCRNTNPDVVVPGAGHVLSMSHPREVTRFLQERIKTHTPGTPADEALDTGRNEGCRPRPPR